jgi:hypothetical protein
MHIGHVPLADDFIKADKVGAQLLKDMASLPEEVYAMLRNISEPRMQNALPQSFGELDRIFEVYEERITARASVPNSIRSPEWLKENGYCVDRLIAANSTIPSAGRGAFTKIPFAKEDVISMSPVIQFKRFELQSEIQFRDENTRQSYFTGRPGYKQLMTNYVFGDEESNVVFVPYAPMVNLINHNSKEPNAYIRWAKTSSFFKPEFLNMTARELLEQTKTGLMIEYVASRDIQPGDEVFLDYGKSWDEAHETFLKRWQERKETYDEGGIEPDTDYISAEDYNRAYGDESIRTMLEQNEDPYPDNLLTACFYADFRDFSIEEDSPEEEWEMVQDEYEQSIRIVRSEWNLEMAKSCLRPCTVLAREKMANGTVFYKAAMELIGNEGIPSYCQLDPKEKHIVTNLPRSAIRLANQEYTSDFWIHDIFRQMIHVPEGMYPQNWMKKKRTNEDPGDFVVLDLETLREPPGVQHVRWNDTGEVVAEYALEAAIPEKLISTLLDFCDQTGITAKFKELVLSPDQSLDEGTNDFATLGGMEWYIQRPEQHWNSNMHWISPGGAEAHDAFLNVLGEGEFDEVLANVGEAMQLGGLLCFHVTFIGVSKCNRGYMHHDFSETNGSGFNVIIPLIVANSTPPELYVRDDEEKDRIGGYRYRIGVASVVGDGAFHATAEVDYTEQQEFRMAATIYVADVNEENVDEIMKGYTQYYPPKDPELLLSQAGMHWGKGQLPKRPKD